MNRTGRPANPEPLTLYQASRPFINQGRAAPGVLLVAYEHDTWMLAVARSSDRRGR